MISPQKFWGFSVIFSALVLVAGAIRMMLNPVASKEEVEKLGDFVRQINGANSLTGAQGPKGERGDPGPGLPVGTIIAFAGTPDRIPNGWIICDGRVLRSGQQGGIFDDLIDCLGTTWGDAGDEDPASIFIPDLRGMFLRGSDDRSPNGGSPDANAPRQVGTIQRESFMRHRHSRADPHSKNDPIVDIQLSNPRVEPNDPTFHRRHVQTGGNPFKSDQDTGDTDQYFGTINTEEGGDETRPDNVAVNWIIKY